MIDLFDELILYRNLNNENTVKLLKALRQGKAGAKAEFAGCLIEEAQKNGFHGNLYQASLLSLIYRQENTFSLSCERREMNSKNPLYPVAERDFSILKRLMELELPELLRDDGLSGILMNYPRGEQTAASGSEALNGHPVLYARHSLLSLEDLISYYEQKGCGQLGLYPMFSFDGKSARLNPILNYDPVTVDDLIGYESQKSALFENTEAFLSGCPANNVLLAGARGTGKSSLVKAVVNKYFRNGLRLVQLGREQLSALPELLLILNERGRHFIIFLDDLSFDNSELQYKHLKSMLEGNASARPKNVLFYATSNRRHLIEERFADKEGSVIENGEIHASDAINEKLSLSDRFGLSLAFSKPTPSEYLAIVRSIARKDGIELPEELLSLKAREWELNQKGLSGRSARQFVNSLMNGKRGSTNE